VSKALQSMPAGTLISSPEITPDELQLAARNHSMPLEALRHAVTPLGLHYLLTHFDIPVIEPSKWELLVGGHVRRTIRLSLDELKARPQATLTVTLECAGNGRARMSPRPLSQPWLSEAVGTAQWTGTSLAPILAEAGLRKRSSEVVFTGLDRGIQGGMEQQYERSLPLTDAVRDEVLLAYAINGQPLPPQHGFPLRLIVPGWYGMAHVKWLRSITVLDHSFDGYQQVVAYHFRKSDADSGIAVTRMLPRALMVPPGIPDFMSRTRFVEPSVNLLEGRAWSGLAPVTRVEFSDDGGVSWVKATLGDPVSPYGWHAWTHSWDATKPGEYELCVRASDAAGNSQPISQNWNLEGVQNNAVQRVRALVGTRTNAMQLPADSR
jgi:sulfane dehydrogenase subunit SoxC